MGDDTPTKICSLCKQDKPVDDYYRRTNGKPHGRCKPCHIETAKRQRDPELFRQYQEQYRSDPANKARFRRAQAKYRRRNPDRLRDYWLRSTYGITLADYDAMFADQSGVCAVCHTPPPDGQPLHVDHCHATAKVRGLLCNGCNRALGFIKDDPRIAIGLAAYLKRAGGDLVT